jgi:hypothetical protein
MIVRYRSPNTMAGQSARQYGLPSAVPPPVNGSTP